MHFKVTLTFLFCIITVNYSENKFGSFKNASRTQNQGSNDHTDLIKKEIKKYMSECGADVSDEDGSESKYNNRSSSSSNNNNNNNNYSSGRYGNNRGQNGQQNQGTNRYGNQNSNNQRGNSGYGQSYGNSAPSHNYNQDQNRNYYHQASYGSMGNSDRDYGSYSNPHRNMDYNRSGFGNYGYNRDAGGYAYGVRNADSKFGKNRNYGSASYNSRRDSFNFDGYIRSKRSEDDVECISQCVFGYLEVLDDNRSPSESAMIKWLQDHLPNDGKRIKAIRDARRCFVRLAASDNEDGCDFSKSLSKCLNLEIEQ